jgi:ComEC/Rec2-related protein
MVIDGWVCSYPQIGGGRCNFALRTNLHGRTLQFLIYTNSVGIDYGDSLRLHGRLLQRRDSMPHAHAYADPYVLSRGAAASVRVKRYGVAKLSGSGGSLLKRCFFWPLHDRMRQEILQRLGGSSGIPLALLLGERGELDKQIRRTFIDLGISHLLALSGMHLGLIAAAILLFMKRCRIRNLFPLLVLLAFYLGMVGEVLSLYRAFGMAVFMVFARMIHRPMHPMRALGTAAFLLLLWSPHIFFSIGFQLSFTATFAVLLCMSSIPMLKSRKTAARLLNYAIGTIYVGMFVQIFMAPLLIHHFDRLSLVSPLATLVFFPFVFAVLFLSILCAGCGSICPWLGDGLALILSPVNGAFAWLLLYAKGVAPSLIRIPPGDPLIYCAGITLMWRSKRKKRYMILGVILLVVSFLGPLL